MKIGEQERPFPLALAFNHCILLFPACSKFCCVIAVHLRSSFCRDFEDRGAGRRDLERFLDAARDLFGQFDYGRNHSTRV